MSSLLPLARLALRLGRVNRVTFHEDGVRPETDTDHTVMLSLIACAVASKHPGLGLDLGLVAQFALVHDLQEAYAGDTPSFVLTEDAAIRKEIAEREASERIGRECVFWPWVVIMIERYERQNEPEARFVRYLDKVCPKLTHEMNGGIAIRKMGYDRARLVEQHRKQERELALRYPEFMGVCGVLLREACAAAETAWREEVES